MKGSYEKTLSAVRALSEHAIKRDPSVKKRLQPAPLKFLHPPPLTLVHPPTPEEVRKFEASALSAFVSLTSRVSA